MDKKRTQPLNEEERLEIMRRIVNLLADKECTAEEAEDILCSAKRSVMCSSIVQHLN